ncbi:MAG: hypothetical protein KDJ15_07950 [Alphaproteobacteria bacterium]|nr:hypothetical protein [Alphaproteobacteria bacterium]
MCFNSSSSSASSSSSDVFDERIGADNGSVAIRELSGGNFSFRDTSEDVANTAIDAVRESSTQALTASTDFIGQAFSQVLSASEKSIDRAQSNLAATRDFAAGLIDKEQESADDRLLKLFQLVAIAGVGIVFLQSGALKDLKGVFK